MTIRPLTVAIDGPSGSGKSSVSRACASRLGIGYLDTGAMYRALAWWCLHEGIDLTDAARMAQECQTFPLVIPLDPQDRVIRVGEHDVSEAIRTPEISRAVGAVATNLLVRPVLKEQQRALIARARAERSGVVVEGRDITTVVAPDAEVRILLTASEEARLARRATELHGQASAATVATTRDQVVARDALDSTVSQFTVAADGVTTVDTSELDFDGSVEAVLRVVERRLRG